MFERLKDQAETCREVRVSVVTYPDRKWLQLEFSDPITGRKYRRSARTQDHKEADRLAQAWEREIHTASRRASMDVHAITSDPETHSLTKQMALEDYLAVYVSRRELSPAYEHQLRSTIRRFSTHLGRPATIADLTVEHVNAFIARLRREKKSDTYRRGRKVHLMVFWWSAADDEILAMPPRRKLVAVQVRDRVTQAWTPAQMGKLLAAADDLDGYYRNGLKRSSYWRAFLLTAWDTGLRGCDLRTLRRSDLGPDGRGVIVQQKTGKRQLIVVRPETLAAIEETFPPKRELLFPLWASQEMWRREAAALIERAGLEGSLKTIRASVGTAYELENPNRGHELLGNTRKVFESNYLDLHQVAGNRQLPPAVRANA